VKGVDPLIERLRVIRCAKGLSQKGAEKHAGLGANLLGTWEAGGNATLKNLRQYAAALGYDIVLVKKAK
jgi:transcriptional regulator with XRE-family HTH domain